MTYYDVCGCYSHFGARGHTCPLCEFASYCKRARDDEARLSRNYRPLEHEELIPAPISEDREENDFIQTYQKVSRFFLSLSYREFCALQIHFQHPEWGWRRIVEEVKRREALDSWFAEQDNRRSPCGREEVLRIINLLHTQKTHSKNRKKRYDGK